LGLGSALLELLLEQLLVAGLEHVRAPLQEQHPEDVFLELRRIHLAAQDVSGGEEVAFELGQGQTRHRSACSAACIPASLLPAHASGRAGPRPSRTPRSQAAGYASQDSSIRRSV